MRHAALWFLKSEMILKISPKLSEARDLPQTFRQTVPQTGVAACNDVSFVEQFAEFVVTGFH